MVSKETDKKTKKAAKKVIKARGGDVLADILRLVGPPQGPRESSVDQKCLKAIDVLGGPPLATAHHEAGHALVGVYLGRKLQAGVLLSKGAEVRFYDRQGETDADLEARVQIAIAGPIAEATFAGHSAGFSGDLLKAWNCVRKLDKRDEAAALARLTRLATAVRKILTAAPVEQVARAIVEGKARTKKMLEDGLRRLEWAEGIEIAVDEAARAASFLGVAAPALQLSPAHRALVQRFVAALRDESREWIFRRAGAIRFVGRDDVAYVSRIGSASSPCFVVVLRADLTHVPDPQAFAIIAHELGHIRHRYREGRATDAGTPGEIQADKFVLECGLGGGLRDHLASELPNPAPDIQAQLYERLRAVNVALAQP